MRASTSSLRRFSKRDVDGRDIGERSDAVLRTAMPGHDERESDRSEFALESPYQFALPRGLRPTVAAARLVERVQIGDDVFPVVTERSQQAADDGAGAPGPAGAMNDDPLAPEHLIAGGRDGLANESLLLVRVDRRISRHEILQRGRVREPQRRWRIARLRLGQADDVPEPELADVRPWGRGGRIRHPGNPHRHGGHAVELRRHCEARNGRHGGDAQQRRPIGGHGGACGWVGRHGLRSWYCAARKRSSDDVHEVGLPATGTPSHSCNGPRAFRRQARACAPGLPSVPGNIHECADGNFTSAWYASAAAASTCSRRCARAVRVVIMDGSFSSRNASIPAAAGGMPHREFGRNDPSRAPASVGSADVDAVLARFPGPVTLHVSRLKFVGLLAASLGLVVALLYILQDDALGPSGTAEAWLGIAFFSIGALVAIVMLLPGAGGLTLGP